MLRLKEDKEYGSVYIKKTLKEEERSKLKKMKDEAKIENHEKTRFFFLVSNEYPSDEVVCKAHNIRMGMVNKLAIK